MDYVQFSSYIDVLGLIQARNQSYKLATKFILKPVGMCMCVMVYVMVYGFGLCTCEREEESREKQVRC